MDKTGDKAGDRAKQSQSNRDLMFFGKVNASISHELKNIFAILSETAGLMTDLMELAAKGGKVEPETLLTCSRDIVEEIQRGFSTIKQMNVFSHSVDDVLKEVDVYEILELVAGITGFLSFTGKVRLNRPAEEKYLVYTCPFRLQHLIYSALILIFQSVGARAEIQIKVIAGDGEGVQIVFSDINPGIEDRLSLKNLERIAETIKAGIQLGDDGRTIDLMVPRRIESSDYIP